MEGIFFIGTFERATDIFGGTREAGDPGVTTGHPPLISAEPSWMETKNFAAVGPSVSVVFI
jgi:hypothetical protein